MNGVPAVIRLWLMGTLWGTACGVASAWMIALVLAIGDGGALDLGGFLIGVVVVAYLGGFYGAAAGLVFGCPTGLLAGIILWALSPLLGPRTVTWVTVVLTLASQVAIGVAVFGPPVDGSLWIYAFVPAVTVGPLTFATRAAARDTSVRRVGHRDTLAV